MAYADASDLIARVDARELQKLVNDDNAEPSRMDLVTNTKITTALDDASGDIDGALLTGDRYSVDDLSGLTGNALSRLKRITCDIAMSYLFDRRPGVNPKLAEYYAGKAQKHLDKLESGKNVFNLTAQQTASTPTIDGPSNVDYQRMNLIPERAHRYYPSRSSRLPTDRN